ncbi:outer membrane beta-barrel protein [Niabella soli]|uniref:Outer membrane protein beta-barrel domain-containing protein n=1 Tax=Niabella soli DSM 19437 TaxID=929713 RepID=W0F8D6_9BACT|nr:outer membrane beta-barrel protein [Niabella soli]AHF17704.1 hypothetical protein NIASO_12805 [Niabella soli DSM 19437]
MKKIVLFLIAAFLLGQASFAQVDTSANSIPPPTKTTTETPVKHKKKYDLTKRANDHFLLQLGYTQWLNTPDSIKTGGLPKTINAYFMLDFPFKTTPQLSAAIGLGIGSDNISLDKKQNFVNVKATSARLPFLYDSTRMTIKKTKLATTYLELPVELRFVADPEHSDRSFKFALGVKVGTMIKADTRTRLQEVGTQQFILKESSKYYFNTTRVAGTARIGVGHFTLFGSYQFTKLLKEGVGPDLRPVTVGLSFGGL